MTQAILEAVNETFGSSYESIQEALSNHTQRELLDTWLRYEGIIGYTDTILRALMTLGFDLDIDDNDFLVF